MAHSSQKSLTHRCFHCVPPSDAAAHSHSSGHLHRWPPGLAHYLLSPYLCHEQRGEHSGYHLFLLLQPLQGSHYGEEERHHGHCLHERAIHQQRL